MDSVFPRFDDLLLKMAYDSICSGKQTKTILVAVEDYIGAMYSLINPEDIPESYESPFENKSEKEDYVTDLLDFSDIFTDHPYVFEALKSITSAYTSGDSKKHTSLKSHLSGLELQQDFIDQFWSYLDNLEKKENPEAIKEFENNVFDYVIENPDIPAELVLSLGTGGIIENAILENLRLNSGDYGDISVDALLTYMNHFVKESVKAVDNYFDKETLTKKLRQMDIYGLINSVNDKSYELTELGNSVLGMLSEHLSEHRDTGRLKPIISVDYENCSLSYRANSHTYPFIASSKINPIVDVLLSMGIYRIIEENPNLSRFYDNLGYPDVSDHNLIKKLRDINFLKSTMGANHLTDDAEYFMINHLIPMLQELDDNPTFGLGLRAKHKQYFTLHNALNKDSSNRDVMFKINSPTVEVVEGETSSLEKAQEPVEPVQQSSGVSGNLGSGVLDADGGQREIQSTLDDIDFESFPKSSEIDVMHPAVEQLLIEGSESLGFIQPSDYLSSLLVFSALHKYEDTESALELPDVAKILMHSKLSATPEPWFTKFEGREFPYGIHVNGNVEIALDEGRKNVIEVLNRDGRVSDDFMHILYDYLNSGCDSASAGNGNIDAANIGINLLMALNYTCTENEIKIINAISSHEDVMAKIEYM